MQFTMPSKCRCGKRCDGRIWCSDKCMKAEQKQKALSEINSFFKKELNAR